MLPTHGVFRAMGVIAVPPVQVQLLRPVLMGLEALDVHVRVQIQSHCGEWRRSLQSHGQLNPGQINTARKQTGNPCTGTSGHRTKEQRPEQWCLRIRDMASFPRATPVAPAPSWISLENINSRPMVGVSLLSHVSGSCL